MMRGIRIVRGYIQVRIYHRGVAYHKNFGPDCGLARQLAEIHLSEKRKEILMGRFGVTQEAPSRKFKDVAEEYYGKWSREKDAEGKLAHGSAEEAGRVIRSNLIKFFGARGFDTIRPLEVQRWRSLRLSSVLGTSVNREQAVLSSIFSHVERWVKTEEWKPMKLPAENPCSSVEKAPNRKRTRVLSILELKALKVACYELKDEDMWEVCGMALKSLLRKKDLEHLESGVEIDTIQAKTGGTIHLPVGVQRSLSFKNFRKRWENVRKAARLVDAQFRDLRKTGSNLLKMRNHSQKMISEFLGHASTRTTEIYMVPDASHLKPLAKDLEDILESL